MTAATYEHTRLLALDAGLEVFGAFHTDAEDEAPDGTRTLILLGPHEPGFWPLVTGTPEFADQAPDPLDRWSARVIGGLAETLGATAVFPFGGPPYQPFNRWAERSGRAFGSPVGLLVHDVAGMMVSYRGALAFSQALDLPVPQARSPCVDCARPCVSACPTGALTQDGYDVPRCRRFLETPEGLNCMTSGCAVRRSCPVSQRYGRMTAQSAFHMDAFS